MMNFKDIPRIFKGLFTTKDVSDDEIKIGISFLMLIILGFAALILCI